MARLLAQRDSTNIHLNLAHRHERLARRYRQTGLADGIKLSINKLKAKADLAEARDLDRQTADDNISAADAEEAIAAEALRRQYEANYLDARKTLSRALAERLFPSSRSSPAPAAAPAPAPAPAN